jgi:hypothetical protein
MSLQDRLEKLERLAGRGASLDLTLLTGAELDRVIAGEIERLGVEAAQKVIDEFLREYKADELRDAAQEN